MSILICTILAGVCLVAAGCNDAQSEEEAISETVRRFYDERYQGDAAKAYALLDSDTQEACDRNTFVDHGELNQSRRKLLEQQDLRFEISTLEWDGTRGTASVRVEFEVGSADFYHNLIKENGKWRLDFDCGQL